MSKFKHLSLAAILLGAFASAQAQTPSHAMYVQKLPTFVNDKGETKNQTFDQYFESWTPGSPLTEDDNFFISRVKPQSRVVDTATQVDPAKTQDRKVCWWCPIGISDNTWTSLPRNKFDADAFSMWQYIDLHGNWSDGWARVPAAFSDAAHRNGVFNGCVLFFDSSVSAGSETGKIINKIIEKNADGTFKNVKKLIQFMKYYGIDGLGINPEGSLTSSMVDPLKECFEECHKVAAEENWHFKIYWYESMTNYGSVSWTDQLSSNNSDWFQRAGKTQPVSDMFMLNYNWGVQGSGKIPNSVTTATGLGRSSYDVYAGFDTQGRWIIDQTFNNPTGGWNILAEQPVSLAFWGAHQKNMIYENANEFGSDALTLQTLYQKKQEQFFTGGTRNPATAPAVTNSVRGASYEGMKKFHGISKFIPARTVLNKLPFVTRFCLGNGEFFNVEGKTSLEKEWYNIGVQDMLPTWRWWVVDNNGNVPADAIECELNYEDSWFGGSALKLSGATTLSNIRMYKTEFNVAASDEVTVRFKLKSGEKANLSLLWSADGTTYKTKDLATTAGIGEWATVTMSAEEAGMTGAVKVLGFTVKDTPNNYSLLIGELSINDKKSYSPATPEITSCKVLTGTYNTVGFKMIFKSKDQDAAKPYEPIYNEDVDTWYFEVYSQIEDEEPVLCTTTTSWASYVIGAPASKTDGVKNRFGVCAVAPDGVTKSPIAWSEYLGREIVTSENILIDKKIIKAGEEFTISFEDPSHKKSYTWEILNSATGAREGSLKSNITSLTTSIDKIGSYDLVVRNARTDKEGTPYRALIQISPDETGATPLIGDFAVSKDKASTNEDVTATFTVKRLGEGKVSRGVAVRDPEMLRLPSEVGATDNYSIAMWFKAEKYAHGRYGTNLINRRDYTTNWPHNNWGSFWVHIWPGEVYAGLKPNVISFTQWNMWPNVSPGFNGNIHESPNQYCYGANHSISENSWTHVVISISGKSQKLWINGMNVATETNLNFGGDNANNHNTPYVYIGGTNVYHGGLIGVVDDVQYWGKALDEAGVADAMKGYTGRAIPADLKGYWDFEETTAAEGSDVVSSFANKGNGGANLVASMVKFEGAGGENTSGTVVAYVKANNDELGNPALSGTLDVKTAVNWDLPGATVTESDKSATMQYAKNGNYDITLNLVNRWGKDSRVSAVLIDNGGGVEDINVADMNVYPNPFVDGVNVAFANSGDYTIEVSSVNGTLVGTTNISAVANEVAYIDVNGNAGVYFVRVKEGNKYLKTLKVIKK